MLYAPYVEMPLKAPNMPWYSVKKSGKYGGIGKPFL